MKDDETAQLDSGKLPWLPPRVLQTVIVLLIILIGSFSWSLGRALTTPGTDSVAARVAEWGRDHGLGIVVTASETVQYWLHPPKVGGTPAFNVLKNLSSPKVGAHTQLKSLVNPALVGEGIFQTKVYLHGQPAVQVAYLRPDSYHTSYLAGVVWMSGSLLKLVQHPGYQDPGHLNLWSQPDTVPLSARVGLVATFNSGFKIRDSRGGFYANKHTIGTLISGAASLIVYKDGHTNVSTWGRSVKLGPDIVSVRQNLTLIINQGQVVVNQDNSKMVLSHWGSAISNKYFVWRSGIGVTASGDLVYVVGDALSVHSLATLLQRAGAVRAMELDINSGWVSYMWYTPGATSISPVPHKLVAFRRPVNGYFTLTSRDFFAVYPR